MRKKVKVSDLIGKHTDLEGTLRCPGDMMIDGHFKGEIDVSGTLIIGENATIEADIRAPYVVVGGDIYGTVITDQGIEILATGKVFGNIQAPLFAIDEGGVFEGRCQMELREASTESDAELIEPHVPLSAPCRPSVPTLSVDHPSPTELRAHAIQREREA
jgi:cytoskeletal protein CcmA (bactofilin family)